MATAQAASRRTRKPQRTTPASGARRKPAGNALAEHAAQHTLAANC
jgi:hypothetical protein